MARHWSFGRFSLLVIAGCLLGASSAAADALNDPTPPPTDQVDELLLRYNLHPAFEKLGRGAGNFLTGWMEVPLNIGYRYTPRDAATSMFTGAALGIMKGFVRTGVGLYEMVTFFLPYPEQYAPILPTLEYFKRDQKRAPLLFE